MEEDRGGFSPFSSHLDFFEREVGFQIEGDAHGLFGGEAPGEVRVGIASSKAVLSLALCEDGAFGRWSLVQCCQVEPNPHGLWSRQIPLALIF